MATAVICEFNPFHNGHKYLLESAKNVLKEPVIAIMSGSFTQRGEVAVCDKFVRAKSALENGADFLCGFNISDNQIVMTDGGTPCNPCSGFKGKDGYSFH